MMTHHFRLKLFTESRFASMDVCEKGVRMFVAGSVMGAQITFKNRKTIASGWVLTATSSAAKFYECWVEDDGQAFACSCAAGSETYVACARSRPRKFTLTRKCNRPNYMCKHVVALGIGVTCLLCWREEPPEVVRDFLRAAMRGPKQLAKSRSGSFGSAVNLYTYGDLIDALQNDPKSKNNKALLSFDLASKTVTLLRLRTAGGGEVAPDAASGAPPPGGEFLRRLHAFYV